MASQWKISEENTVMIDLGPYDIYNESVGFILHYKLKGNANTTDSGISFSEVMHNIASPIALTIDGIQAVSATEITVLDATGVIPGQVYNSGTVYFYVSNVIGNTIYLRRPLSAGLADAATATQVGNTGIYEANLTLGSLGQFTIIISSPDIGLLNEVTKVEVVSHLTEDVYNKVNGDNIGINTKLDSISSSLGNVDSSVKGTLIL